jgi:hypothetical protein
VHHVFPRQLLKSRGKGRGEYNQIANYAFTQDAINIKIGSKSPHQYFADVQAQCGGAPLKLGGIDQREELQANLAAHCLPDAVLSMTVEDYPEFLVQRRALMAAKIRNYYLSL